MIEKGSAAGGRPRDPDVDRRIRDAALAVFGDNGWQGFSVDAVARRARVGRATVYLRWATKEEVLAQAVRDRIAEIAVPERDDLRAELLDLTQQLLSTYQSESGKAVLRLWLEAHRIPAVQEPWRAITDSYAQAASSIIRRAVDRGELPSTASATLILDTLCGGVLAHALGAPEPLHLRQWTEPRDYGERLVDFILARADALAG